MTMQTFLTRAAALTLLVFMCAFGAAHAEIHIDRYATSLHDVTVKDRGDLLMIALPLSELKEERLDTGAQVFTCTNFQGVYKDLDLSIHLTHTPYVNPTGTADIDPMSQTQLEESVARFNKEHPLVGGMESLRNERLTVDKHLAARITQRFTAEKQQTIYDTLLVRADRGEWLIEVVYKADSPILNEAIETMFNSVQIGRASLFRRL